MYMYILFYLTFLYYFTVVYLSDMLCILCVVVLCGVVVDLSTNILNLEYTSIRVAYIVLYMLAC